MLAKLWKKILLAICIIAILFNITSKFVKRYSLDEELNSVVGKESLSAIFDKDKDKNSSSNTTNKKTNSEKQNTNKKNNKKVDEEIEEDEEDEEEIESDEDENDDSDEDVYEQYDVEFDEDEYYINFNKLIDDYIEENGF